MNLYPFFVCIGLPRGSYWPYAFEGCGLEEDEEESCKYKHINYYWGSVRSPVFDMVSQNVHASVKSVPSLFHGNAVPERGFSINKKLLDSHGTATYEDIIVAQ